MEFREKWIKSIRLVIAASAVLTSCTFPHAIRAPAITQGLQGTTYGEEAFDVKVKSQFPIGSEESAMHAELAREGFTINQTNSADGGSVQGFEASAMTNDSVCDMTWTIDWASQHGKLTYVAAKSLGVCY